MHRNARVSLALAATLIGMALVSDWAVRVLTSSQDS
jgi:hypothetical protein